MKSLITSRNALILFVMAFMGFMPGIVQLRIETDASSALLFEGEEYEKFLEEFPSDYGSKIVVPAPESSISQWWQDLKALHYDLEELDEVYRVESLINARHTARYVFDDGEVGLEMSDFIDYDTELDQTLWKKAKAYPPYKDVLVSKASDGSYRALILIIARGPTNEVAYEEPFDAIVFDDAVSEVLTQHVKNFSMLQHVGEPRISAENSAEILRSTLFIGIVLSLIVLIVKFDTGYWRLGVLSAFTGGMGLYFAWATMGYAGIARNPINDVVVQMIIPIGAAFVVHAHGYAKHSRHATYEFLLGSSVRSFGFATLTTSIGFGATGISPYPGIQQFGIFGVVGILACLFTTVSLVFPALIKLNINAKPSGLVRLFQLISNNLIQRPIILSKGWTYVALVVTSVFVAIGLFWVEVNYVPSDYLGKNNPIRQEFEEVRKEEPIYTMNLVIRGPKPLPTNDYGAVISPRIMIAADDFSKRLENHPEFDGFRAISIWEQLCQIWTDGEYEVPDTRQGVAQQLAISFSDSKHRELYLSPDGSTMSILFQVSFKGSKDFRILEQEVENFENQLTEIFAEISPDIPAIEVNLVGRIPFYLRAGDRVVQANTFALMGAGLALLLLFWILLGSFQVAAQAMIANIFPVLICLSLMGWFGFPLGIAATLVITISLCLVVDDTGHFLVSYSRYRKEGMDANTAVRETLAKRWEQIFVTTIVIVIGFVPMVFAPLVPFRTFAILLGSTMLFALASDLILLPSLLVNFDRRDMTKTRT